MTPEQQLLAAVEGLMVEVRGLREDMRMSRDSTATMEMVDLRRKAAELDSLRKTNAARRKRNRESGKVSRDMDATSDDVSRDSTATNGSANPPELLNVARQSRTSVYPLKDLRSRSLEDQEKKKDLKASTRDRDSRATVPIWQAYSTAYRERYHADPVRNATINGQLAHLVSRLGTEAPEVAAFYVRHSSAYYVQRGHAVGCMLADAEKLRTEWATGRQITGTEARQQEKTAANMGGWERMLKREPDAVG